MTDVQPGSIISNKGNFMEIRATSISFLFPDTLSASSTAWEPITTFSMWSPLQEGLLNKGRTLHSLRPEPAHEVERDAILEY
jgi:hypothetical protein